MNHTEAYGRPARRPAIVGEIHDFQEDDEPRWSWFVGMRISDSRYYGTHKTPVPQSPCAVMPDGANRINSVGDECPGFSHHVVGQGRRFGLDI